MSSERLRIVADASCLHDARRDAGIGRYAASLLDALGTRADVDVVEGGATGAPWSEARPWRVARAQPSLLRTALRERGMPAVLHGLGGDATPAWPLRRQLVTVHDVRLWEAGAARGGRWRDAGLGAFRAGAAALLRRCAALIVVSAAVADDVVGMLGVRRERVHVVPHGVSAVFGAVARGDDSTARARAGVAEGVAYVVWAGSLRHHDPRKGLDPLLAAMHRLGEDAPVLMLAGAGGPEGQRLREQAAQRSVRVHLPGHVDDATLAALLRGAAAAVVPSLHEGFGLTALEAMACGAPVVATRAGNLPELTADAAVMVEPGDARSLAEGLRRVLRDSDLAARLRRIGPQRAATFTWDAAAARTVDVYRVVLQSSGRVPFR